MLVLNIALFNLGSKEMSLSQLPKLLQKKRIIDIVLLDYDAQSNVKQ